MTATIISFRNPPKPNRPPKAIVAHDNGLGGFAVSILPAETEEERAWGMDFELASQALHFAHEAWILFGEPQGLVLVDAIGALKETAS